jgi:pimeloyl-ACP methyl ester carboxylesterase
MWSSGYVFAFQLPPIFVNYLGTGGNNSFLKLAHVVSYKEQEYTPTDAAECMASTVGPSIHEGETRTADGDGYAVSAVKRRAFSNFFDQCSYYRDGAAISRWNKSLETIASLHSIAEEETTIHRTNSGAGIFDDGPEGALKARTTIVWGKKDHALTPKLCLDGMSDYLSSGSQFIELPESRHFTPLERESRLVLTKVVEWAVKGEQEDVGAAIKTCYPTATVTISK